MLKLAADYAPGAVEMRQLTLPDDPIPQVDAIVSVGHMISYLPDELAARNVLASISRALRPGGIFAIDVVDIEYGRARSKADTIGRIGSDWGCIIEYATPEPKRFTRRITTFIANQDGSYHRDDEWHSHILLDASSVPALLAADGVEVEVLPAFGIERLLPGLCVLVGRRPRS